MRTFLVLICSLALAFAVGGAQEENKSKKPAPKKKQAQSAQHAAAPSGGAQKTKGSQRVTTTGGLPVGAGTQKTKKAKGPQQVTTTGGRPVGAGTQKTKGSQHIATHGAQKVGGAAGAQKIKKSKVGTTSAAAHQSGTKTFQAQHSNLPTNAPPITVSRVK